MRWKDRSDLFLADYDQLSEKLKMEAPVLVRGVLMGDEDAAPRFQ